MSKKIVVLGLLLMSFGAFAQERESTINKTTVSVEIDPSTFALRGYGFHLRVKPKNSEHLVLGVGAYAMDFPKVLVNLNPNNKDLGWHARLNQGYGLFGEYHFGEVNNKWYVGGQLAYQQYNLEKDYYDGDSKFSNMLLMGLGGYTLKPFDFGLYFKFWGGLGYQAQISGENFIGNAEYDVAPLLMFGALHIGYEF